MTAPAVRPLAMPATEAFVNGWVGSEPGAVSLPAALVGVSVAEVVVCMFDVSECDIVVGIECMLVRVPVVEGECIGPVGMSVGRVFVAVLVVCIVVEEVCVLVSVDRVRVLLVCVLVLLVCLPVVVDCVPVPVDCVLLVGLDRVVVP